MNIDAELRDFLSDHTKFKSYLEELIGGLDPKAKGDKWQEIVREVVPNTDFGRKFPWGDLEIVGRTNDGGVDLIAKTEDDNTVLYVQARYNVNRVDNLDEIVSKFQGYYDKNFGPQKVVAPKLPGLEDRTPSPPQVYWMIVTMHDVKSNILPRYLRSHRPSLKYFEKWRADKRIEIIDGLRVWQITSQAWEYKFGEPPNLELTSVSGWLEAPGSVYIGVVSSKDLREIYQEARDTLFFENVRPFQGYGKGTVNEAIRETVVDNPERLLQLNNGLVLRAKKITSDKAGKKIHLERASIVNGVQTTTVVNENATEECYLQVKAVETNNPWELTNAANFQNQIHRIDLEIAEYMRPQIIERASYPAGVVIDKGDSREKKFYDLKQILGVVAQTRMAYRDVRFLFLGLFSDTPNNIFVSAWDRVRFIILENIAQNHKLQFVYETLFELYKTEQLGISLTKENVGEADEEDLFNRFIDKKRSRYVQYLTILAACVSIGIDISKRLDDPSEEYERVLNFFDSLRNLLAQDPSGISVMFVRSFQTIASQILMKYSGRSSLEMSRAMFSEIEQSKFTQYYTAVRIATREVSVIKPKENAE